MSARWSVVLGCCFVCSNSFAAPKWYIALGAGYMLPEYSQSVQINNNSGFTPPSNQDIYTADRENNANILAEVGRRWSADKYKLKAVSLGLQYQHMFASDIGNNITQYSNPDFLNYNYHLDFKANLLLLNSNIELFTWNALTPYLSVGAGLIQLIATDYTETALAGVTARTSPDFKREAGYQFAYQLGAGLNYQIRPDTSVALSYLYQHLGKLKTEKGSAAWSDRSLDFGNAYSHTFFVTLSHYLAC